MSLRTTVVGSWWPLPEHEQDLDRYHAGQLSAEEAKAVLNRATTAAIAEQRALGLDEWTGGEYFTRNFIFHIHEMLTGLEMDKPERSNVFDYDDMAHVRIVGEVDAPNGLGYTAAFKRESRLPGGVNKAAVVSPLEMLAQGRDQVSEIQRQMKNLTRIVNRELRALADAGCRNVQLDAPVLGWQVNIGAMTARAAAELITACLEGVTARKSLHLCNGNLRGRPISRVLSCAPWVGILHHLDGVIDVAHLEVKYYSQYLERDAFREMPRGIELAAGIVDEGSYWIEPAEKIRERAADWARVVGEERLWLAPSCGFGRHPARDVPVLRAKLENMMEAARTF
jgi:5-methyltetrahydropteroyltriglutamate--homocysteine methyltransferase